jgi:serpin B
MSHNLIRAGLALVLAALVVTGCAPATAEPSPCPTPTQTGEVAAPPEPARARDAALEALAEVIGDDAPPPDLAWDGERITSEGLVGSSSFRYTAGDWVVIVSFPLVAPEATVYTVSVSNPTTGLEWDAQLDARFEVLVAEGQPTPAVTVEVATGAEVANLVAGNTAFAWDLYHALRAEDDNLFYSPYSISLALAMTYVGARGETEQQMANTLRFALPQARLHPAFQALHVELAQRAQGDGGFQLNVANALWGQEGEPFLTEFLQTLTAHYGAGMHRVDFAAAPQAARQTINEWVATETQNKIQDLLPPNVIDAMTRLVLTNAIYFRAGWSLPFDPQRTYDGPFYPLSGGEVTVPLMSRGATFPYAQDDGWQAVELPYQGDALSMVVLVPGAGEFEAFERSLDAPRVDAILDALEGHHVALTLPTFEFESGWSLKDVLAQMGMPLAFSGAADFTGISRLPGLYIGEVIHKAFVSVDEAGTEAAAATAVVMPRGMAPEEPVELRVDRPFLFLIRDLPTGTVLFVGRVVNPLG